MAMIDHRPQLPFGTLTAQFIASGIRSLRARISRWLEVRRTVRILSQLQDAQLSDLGLTRGDIAAFARKGRF